jgi:sugar lactone lactonase YvrE
MIRIVLVGVALLAGLAVAHAGPALEVVATMSEGPGNIAVTPDGRVIVSLHGIYEPSLRVVEVVGDSLRPFPNARWNRPPDGADRLDSVLGLRADRTGVVWLLDNGLATGASPKIVAWNTRTDRLERILYVPPEVTSERPYLNDLAVDLDHGAIYIADPSRDGRPALILVDIATGAARRLLESHPSVMPEDISLVIDGRPLRVPLPDGGFREPRLGINPITVDAANEWVYYGPMSGRSLYRVRTRDLLDEGLAPEALGRRVERYGDKPLSGGITVDDAGNVYVTDLAAKGVGVTGADGSYRLLVSDDELLDWPDGFATGADGAIYVTVNRLHKSARLNAGVDESEPPYYVVRFKPLAPVTVGR